MTHDASTDIARLAYREAHARWTGDMVRAAEARDALEAAVVRVPNEDWPAVHAAYRATLCDNRHE